MVQTERQRALAEYEVLDSLPEKEFDDIVELASAICGTPISAISLLDLDRQWFKAQVGLAVNQTPIEMSFCRYAVNDLKGVMVINDSTKDERFKNNPLTTGDPNIRFYAGAPLITPGGVALGALCVIDRKPREFNAQEQRMLQVLAQRVMKMLDMRKDSLLQKKIIIATTQKLDTTVNRLLEAQETARLGNWEWNMLTGEVYWSPQLYALISASRKPVSITDTSPWEEIIHPGDLPEVKKMLDTLMADHKPTVQEYRIINKGEERWMLAKSAATVNAKGQVLRLYGTLQDITERKNAEKQIKQYTASLEGMLFDVSHKLRKPITTLLGLLPALNGDSTNKEDFTKASTYFHDALKELETYTREWSDMLHKNKLDMEAGKA